MKSTLSVVLTSYNYAHYLPTALEALVNQTLTPLEILIIDDASTDTSVEIIKRYQARYSYIHLYQNPVNLGVVASANRGIDLAQGDYLVLCAADDETLPTFFEESLALLEKHPQAAYCSSIYACFYDGQPHKLLTFSSLLSKNNSFLPPKSFFNRIKIKDARLPIPVFKREALLEAGKLRPELKSMCDWFLICTLGLRHGVCFIPKPLNKMRIHEKAYSQVISKDPQAGRQMFESVAHVLSQKNFADVEKAFIQSGVIYQLGLSIIPLLFKRVYFRFVTPALVWHLGILILKHYKFEVISHLKRFFKKSLFAQIFS